MGHKIGKAVRPKRGSRAFIPRVRAKRPYPRIKNWPKVDDVRLLGFAAYKAGMAHVTYVDNSAHSPTKGEVITVPVTILDAPKLKFAAIRFYGLNSRRMKNVIGEVWAENLDKDLARKIKLPKKQKKVEEELSKINLNDVVDIRALVYTLPKGRAGKKKPEIFEIAIGGNDINAKFEYAKANLGKEISVSDVLKPGEQVDVIAVTKGKGFQGTVKRYGVKLQSKKTDRTRRGVAAIGPDVPRKVHWGIPMPGQMGYHNRFDYNKWILKIGNNGIAPKGGFLNYGVVKEDYIILKGSVPGPAKRLIRMRLAINPKKTVPTQPPEILTISKVEKK
ncbi:MAG: 50S ribosomal protein L3 [Nanoarchaeota archaeon]|nr:50S ribosomal protein L3 [Nanoarchaeota archaeon]